MRVSQCFEALDKPFYVMSNVSSSRSASCRKFTHQSKHDPTYEHPPLSERTAFLPFLKEKRIKFSWARLEPPTNARRLWVHLCSFVRVKPKSLSASRIRRLVYLHEQTNVRQIWCALSSSTFFRLATSSYNCNHRRRWFAIRFEISFDGQRCFIRPLTTSVKRNTIIITISSHNATRRAGTAININLHPIWMFFGRNRARSVDAS